MRTLAAALVAAGIIFMTPAAWGVTCVDAVTTAEGPVTGYADKHEEVCAYKGIPYAAPPVGDMRWKAPGPALSRSGTLDAKEFGYRCISGGSGSGATKSMIPKDNEDCLTLNIWRPKAEGTYPVMVWIHGGSLTSGTAAEPLYYGERLSGREKVVVVSINYRLNYYGFLAHRQLSAEDPHGSSGNYGLLDQIAALEWVRANIGNFGGDPGNVTIFGESAGGWSMCNLMASPLAAGLFHRVVLESGGCDAYQSLEDGFTVGRTFARKLGCQGDDTPACLRSLTPDQISKKLKRAESGENKDDKGLSLKTLVDFKWVPHGDHYALNESPKAALQSGRFNRAPLMVGSNRDEIKLMAVAVPGLRLLPWPLVKKGYAQMFGEDVLAGSERLYPYKDYKRPMDMLLDAAGDMALGCPCWEAAEAVAAHQPVYYYRYDFDRHIAPDLVGACHGLEIAFVFDNLDKFPVKVFLTPGQKKKAEKLAEFTMSYWANFARTGDPNGPGLPDWPAYQAPERERMYFSLDSHSHPTDNVDKCEFWRGTGITIMGKP